MEHMLKPPQELVFDKNIDRNFAQFKLQFEFYMTATGLDNKPDARKVAIFLSVAGAEALNIFQTLNLTAEQKQKYNDVVKAFAEYCKPRVNQAVERFKFFNRRQQVNESFDHFLTDLKLLAKNCSFEQQEESLLRDLVIIGIRSNELRESLLRIPDVTLKTVEQSCRASESSKFQAKQMAHNEHDVYQVKRGSDNKRSNQERDKKKEQARYEERYDCKKCGRRHGRSNCPAYGKKCNVCKGLNHFEIGCFKRNSNNKTKKQIAQVESEIEQESSQSPELFVDLISVVNNNKLPSHKETWYERLKINNKMIVVKLDTGAQCNILPINLYNKIRNSDDVLLDNCSSDLRSYGGNKLNVFGTKIFDVFCRNKLYKVKFVIVGVEGDVLLGGNACIKMNLVKKVLEVSTVNNNNNHSAENVLELINENKKVFQGTGLIPFKYKIILKANAVPVVSSCRRVADKIMPRLKESLENLVQRDIIYKIEEPTEWVNNITIVEKNDGSIRICLDPVNLNKNICYDQHPIPTVEEISLKLRGKSVFTVLDMKEGFYHVQLDDESCKLCTFITPFGKYCFKRLPFGLSVSPEVFQRMNEKVFEGLEVGIYFDDIVIAGKDEYEHDMLLKQVIERAKKFGVVFNTKKIQYKSESIRFLGQIFNKEGVRPNNEYIQAILAIEKPKNKKEVLRFLGMVNYLIKYLPSLSELSFPLRQLIKNNIEFVWTSDIDKSFVDIKQLIANITTLKIFDPNLPIVVQTDASQYGIGGCLLQEGQPIAFCSKSLTNTEIKYSQIEKEYLAIAFCLKKFHYCVYGRFIKINSDHKPLVAIHEKEFNKVSLRLQRIKLQLLPYNFTVEYLPGKFLFIADLLSRSFIKVPMTATESDTPVMIHNVEVVLPISDERLKEIRVETAKDENLKEVRHKIENEWPRNIKEIKKLELKHYYKIKDKLLVKDDLIFFNEKLVIPKSLRLKMLKKLHIAHFGVSKTKARARKIFYWPGINNDIENFILKCQICIKYSNSNIKEPLIAHERSETPFQKVGIDILDFCDEAYLVLVDYYSNWIDLVKLKSKTAHECITHLKRIFANFGIPNIVISDNVPFKSQIFDEFAKTWEFTLITSSPRYPKSNGLAEKAVGIAKAILKKCYETNTDIQLALLEYRNSPVKDLKFSPSEMLNSRLLRTSLPINNELLKPTIVHAKFEKHFKTQKHYYDRSARKRENFNIGDSVYIQNEEGLWETAIIIKKATTPRSYVLRKEGGKVVRRNSSFIKKSKTEHTAFEDPFVDNFVNQPDDVNKETVDEPTVENAAENSELRTTSRSNRVIRKPLKYNDFEMN